jgi:hypothetical protein
MNDETELQYMVSFQFGSGSEYGFGTTDMSFKKEIRRQDIPNITQSIRNHFGRQDLVVTAFSQYAD